MYPPPPTHPDGVMPGMLYYFHSFVYSESSLIVTHTNYSSFPHMLMLTVLLFKYLLLNLSFKLCIVTALMVKLEPRTNKYEHRLRAKQLVLNVTPSEVAFEHQKRSHR